MTTPLIFTVGHSTRSLDAFVELVRAHGIDQVADVRKMPRSRYNPQFNIDTMPEALRPYGIGYRHVPELGGLRHSAPGDTNAGWRNRSFRAYADYMQTAAFAAGLELLIALAADRRAAIMCAEAVPWRCHRSLIADALVVRGFEVLEIISGANTRPHQLTPFASVAGTSITYPAAVGPLFADERSAP